MLSDSQSNKCEGFDIFPIFYFYFTLENSKEQEIIDWLRKEIKKLREDKERLRREIDEYKNRHPSVVGVKNGKAYEIRQGIGSVFQNLLYPLYTEIEEE